MPFHVQFDAMNQYRYHVVQLASCVGLMCVSVVVTVLLHQIHRGQNLPSHGIYISSTTPHCGRLVVLSFDFVP